MSPLSEKCVFLCQICMILLAITLRLSVAQSTLHALESRVDDIISGMLECKPEMFGLTLSVVKDGRVLLQKGYGVADREQNTIVDEYSLFGIASLTKAFTTTLLMKILEGHENITLDNTVSEILGDDFQFSDELRTKYATLRDLMSHRLGLPAHNKIRFQQNLSRKELARRFRYINATGEFRSTYYYNNIVYGLLTYITEVLGNDTWENLMTREIFEPLGMMNTTFGHTIDPRRSNRAAGYATGRDGNMQRVPEEITKLWDSLGGSGSILSNAVDMNRWMLFHLTKGKNESGHQVVQSATLRENHTPWVIMYTGINKYIRAPKLPTTFVIDRYASGWRNGFYRDLPTLSHTGSTWGYQCILIMYPDQDLGIFLALNGEDWGVFGRTSLLSYIADVVLGYEPWLNKTTACTFPEPWNKDRASFQHRHTDISIPSSRPLSTYVGSYVNTLYGELHISVNETMNCTNCLRMTYGISTWNLYPRKFGTSHFSALGTNLGSFINAFHLEFHVADGILAQEMVIPYFDTRDPPVFRRIS